MSNFEFFCKIANKGTISCSNRHAKYAGATQFSSHKTIISRLAHFYFGILLPINYTSTLTANTKHICAIYWLRAVTIHIDNKVIIVQKHCVLLKLTWFSDFRRKSQSLFSTIWEFFFLLKMAKFIVDLLIIYQFARDTLRWRDIPHRILLKVNAKRQCEF